MSRPTASDLAGFGTRVWTRGLLEDPTAPKYFGATPQLTGMKTWKEGSKLSAEQLDQVADFVAELADVGEDESFIDWYERRYDGGLDGHPGHDLFVEDCGLTSLIGLERCRALRKLRAEDNEIDDLRPLAELAELREIDLEGNRVSDLTPLYALTGKRSISPAPWLHAGLSVPRPGTSAFAEFESELLRRIETGHVRTVVASRGLEYVASVRGLSPEDRRFGSQP